MYLTEDNFKQIRKYLELHGIKNTEYSFANPLKGDEIITFVQNGKNVKFTLNEFYETYIQDEIDNSLSWNKM